MVLLHMDLYPKAKRLGKGIDLSLRHFIYCTPGNINWSDLGWLGVRQHVHNQVYMECGIYIEDQVIYSPNIYQLKYETNKY